MVAEEAENFLRTLRETGENPQSRLGASAEPGTVGHGVVPEARRRPPHLKPRAREPADPTGAQRPRRCAATRRARNDTQATDPTIILLANTDQLGVGDFGRRARELADSLLSDELDLTLPPWTETHGVPVVR